MHTIHHSIIIAKHHSKKWMKILNIKIYIPSIHTLYVVYILYIMLYRWFHWIPLALVGMSKATMKSD
mgnify:CR=1 FL=1